MYERKKWHYLLLIFSLVVILAVTIYPFDFRFERQVLDKGIIDNFQVFTSIKDYVRNILLFIPFGIALGGIFQSKEKHFWQVVFSGLLISSIFSTNIESTQILLPSRTSILSDIACNGLGGMLGASLYYSYRDFRILINGIVSSRYHIISLKYLAGVIVTYCSAIACALVLFYNSVNFDNWNEKAYLSVASEMTGQIFWRGYINSLYICDRALEKSEIDRAFYNTHTFFSSLPSLVTNLEFFDLRPYYQDKTKTLPDLHWHRDLPEKIIDRERVRVANNNLQAIGKINKAINRKTPILFAKQNSLISTFPATKLSQKLKKSQEFSLNLILATDKLKQKGPARIISLGENIYSRNLMIGQEGSNLIFRLRTNTTGRNAVQPGFYFPDFFQDSQWHQILITYAKNQLNFYLDSPQNIYTFDFQPATHTKLFLPWTFQQWRLNIKTHNLLIARLTFYSLVLTPLIIFSGIFMIVLNSKLKKFIP